LIAPRIAKKSTANQYKEHNVEKFIQWVDHTMSLTVYVYSYLADVGLLPPKSANSREIL